MRSTLDPDGIAPAVAAGDPRRRLDGRLVQSAGDAAPRDWSYQVAVNWPVDDWIC